jgi:hypothetical protein
MKSSRWGNHPNETNDCSVIALAIAARITYDEAHDAMRRQGRKDREGTFTDQSVAAFEMLGLELVNIPALTVCRAHGRNRTLFTDDDFKGVKTPLTLAPALQKIAAKDRSRTFVVVTSSHMFTARAGIIHDWIGGRRHRIVNIYEVTDAAEGGD